MHRVGALLVVLGLALGSQSASAGMAKTHPSHMKPRGGQVQGLPQPSLPDFREPSSRNRVILRGNASPGNAQPRLSKACREGNFRQRIDRRFIAVMDGTIYGAAVGGRNSLVDRLGLGNDGLIYLFAGQGTTSCRVYVGGTGRG